MIKITMYFQSLFKACIKENYKEINKLISDNILSFMETGPLFEQTVLYSGRELRKSWLRFKIAFWESLIKQEN